MFLRPSLNLGFFLFPTRILPLFLHVPSFDTKESCESEDFPEFFSVGWLMFLSQIDYNVKVQKVKLK